MKNPEETIDRVLTGLRDAEAPAGMEARILLAVAARAAEMQARGDWRRWVLLRRSRGFRLAGGVAIAALVVSTVVSMRKTSSVAKDGRSVGATVASSGFAGAKEAVPQRLKPRESGGVYGTAEAVPLSKTADPQIEAQSHLDYASLAMSEMLAPSRPAPPLPLTHQEKLLAEVVRKGDPEQVADLKPEVRAKQIEIAKAEFHAFFEPPFLIPAPVKGNE